MSIIYSLVARDKMVLADYSSFSGNFDTFAQQVALPSFRSSKRLTLIKSMDSLSQPIIITIL